MVSRISADRGGTAAPERLVESCLDQLGAISVSDRTHASLAEFAASSTGALDEVTTEQTLADLLKLAATTAEFQRC